MKADWLTGSVGARWRSRRSGLCTAAHSGKLLQHESFAARALILALNGRPPGYTVLELRWKRDRNLFYDAEIWINGLLTTSTNMQNNAEQMRTHF